jgi:hypothetical protein
MTAVRVHTAPGGYGTAVHVPCTRFAGTRTAGTPAAGTRTAPTRAWYGAGGTGMWQPYGSVTVDDRRLSVTSGVGVGVGGREGGSA